MDVESAKAAVADLGIFSEDQCAALSDMIDAMAVRRPPGSHPSIPMMTFLRRWVNEPVPDHILAAGAEVLVDDDYTPKRRVHQIVQKCAMLWLEDAA